MGGGSRFSSFFQFGDCESPRSQERWERWSEEVAEAVASKVALIAERWRWSEREILNLPVSRRKHYVETIERLNKQKSAK